MRRRILREIQGLLVVLGAVSACGDGNFPVPGTQFTVQSTVTTITFDNLRGGDEFRELGDRYLLLDWPVDPLTGNPLEDALRKAWGLGVHIPADEATQPSVVLPHTGDVVLVTGTFAYRPWNGHTLPMLEQVTRLVVVRGQLPRRALGQACNADMECRDRLICERETRRCAELPVPVSWGGDVRNLNGACLTDGDCPVGQFCDVRYTIPASGPYAPGHRPQDAGAHLCVPLATATRRSLCPVVDLAEDLVGGRYVPGKEVCIGGHVFINAFNAPDRDFHNQLIIARPLVYPSTDPPLWLVGASTETTAPYRDPTRPEGAQTLPFGNAVILGTYRFDPGHGWFEIHAVKAWWPID